VSNAVAVLLGTSGGPIPAPGRAMAANAVLVDDAAYLVDCGGGASRQIVAAGIPYGAIRALFITHLHGDHVMDYAATLPGGKPFAPGQGFERVVQVHGPSGTEGLHAGLLEAFAHVLDVQYRQSSLGPDIRDLVEVRDVRMSESDGDPLEVYADEHVRVSATVVEHPPVRSSLALRFDTSCGSLVFSGDTAPSENLVRLAQGADLLVHEAMNSHAMLDGGVPERFVRMLRRMHTDVTEVGKIAAAAAVGRLALTHLIPTDAAGASFPDAGDLAWIDPVRADYAGPITIGFDLIRLPLRGSDQEGR
jgi:ribonuclease BN (tRNA processing enzyme)